MYEGEMGATVAALKRQLNFRARPIPLLDSFPSFLLYGAVTSNTST